MTNPPSSTNWVTSSRGNPTTAAKSTSPTKASQFVTRTIGRSSTTGSADRLEDFQRVLQPRALALEKEALQDPDIRQALEQRDLQIRYWRACASALADSDLTLRENDPAKGRVVCRFARLDDGIRFGVQYYPSNNDLTVYLGVTSSASRNQRRLFKDMLEAQIPELETLVGQKLHVQDPYFWVAISADLKAQSDWPRQHQWIKETGNKFITVLKPRLAIP
jgi:hypothetical protein